MEWFRCAIPKSSAERIERIRATLGFSSISAYVAAKLSEVLPRDENRYEEVMEALKNGTIKQGGDEGEL